MLTHVLNLAMSILGAVDVINAAATVGKQIVEEAGVEGGVEGQQGRVPNPCSFYLLNLGIDVSPVLPILPLLFFIQNLSISFTHLWLPHTARRSRSTISLRVFRS